MKTIKETIRVTPNHSRRTFTIRTYINGKFFAKYRTYQMKQKEFDSEERNTQSDWKQFLKSDDYYSVG